jgi:hypothetical protein
MMHGPLNIKKIAAIFKTTALNDVSQLLSLNTSEEFFQSSVSAHVFQTKDQELHHTSESLVDKICNFPDMVGKK